MQFEQIKSQIGTVYANLLVIQIINFVILGGYLLMLLKQLYPVKIFLTNLFTARAGLYIVQPQHKADNSSA